MLVTEVHYVDLEYGDDRSMNEWMNEIFILFCMNYYYKWEQVMSQMDETIEMVM